MLPSYNMRLVPSAIIVYFYFDQFFICVILKIIRATKQLFIYTSDTLLHGANCSY